MPIERICESLEETMDFGMRLSKELVAGDIILLRGPLGAGKTALVRGIVGGLDPSVARLVSSQSYVVAGEYPTRPLVVHLDLYRLSSQADVLALGYEELVYGEDRIVIVEWPGLLEPLLEADDAVLRIELSHGSPSRPDRRYLTASSSEPRLEEAARAAAMSGEHDMRRRDL
jgi:tRNA threonylcarbamoyladenosine biosynthesis protein TsaE